MKKAYLANTGVSMARRNRINLAYGGNGGLKTVMAKKAMAMAQKAKLRNES